MIQLAEHQKIYCTALLCVFIIVSVLFTLQIEKYVATSKLKYYFAVDTTYVGKKLGLLLFPYAHSVRSCYYCFGLLLSLFVLLCMC